VSAPSRIRLEGVAKKYGDVIAVYPLDLEVPKGEFLVLLGPSGCGKTTTLRMMAGLETPTQGKVLFNGRDATFLRPGARDVAFVFQLFSLYPHLTVRENVAFTQQAQGIPAREAGRQAFDMLRRLGLEALAAFHPEHLSGADQQRVGLARALVRRPQAFLMDEPLGTLDGDLRAEMRAALRSIHNQSGATTVFVTHDQEEALGLADRIAVMRDGRAVQIGSPRALYDRPADIYVADFLGSPGMNLMRARREGEWAMPEGLNLALRVSDGDAPSGAAPDGAAQAGGADDLRLGVRPENVVLDEAGAPCSVEQTQALGAFNLLTLRAGTGFLKAWLPAGVRFREGETVRVSFLPSGCRWFGGPGGRALPWTTWEAACPVTR
jgi:multiple sugar transport system ATP-binding protein